MERWVAKKKTKIVLDVTEGSLALMDFCRGNDLRQSAVDSWMETFVEEATLRYLRQGERACYRYLHIMPEM